MCLSNCSVLFRCACFLSLLLLADGLFGGTEEGCEEVSENQTKDMGRKEREIFLRTSGTHARLNLPVTFR